MMILAEELLLLTHDDAAGRARGQQLGMGLSGAVLMDLALAQRIDVPDKTVRVVKPAPMRHVLLDDLLTRMARDKPRKPKVWVQRGHSRMTRRVTQGLVEQGVLRHEVSHVLGFIPWNRYVCVSASLKDDVRSRLAATVDNGRAPDERTAALASLVYAARLEKQALPQYRRHQVRKTLKKVSRESWVSDATHKAVEAAQAAVNAAITAAVAASASGGAGGN